MAIRDLGPLSFDEFYAERIWGGRKLETVYGKPIPPSVPVGEAWLVSDHPQHISTVRNGQEHVIGRTLRELLEEDARAILGSYAGLTVHGRFPLLLKILDTAEFLSVQVHPDDAAAVRLGESDVGKSEMWHILEAEPGSQLICGLHPEVDESTLRTAIRLGTLGSSLVNLPVSSGTSVFVPAGTVHAIGPGILLSEIQQNSDITYRIHDWDRVQSDGTPRTLHIEKSLGVVDYRSRHMGAAKPLAIRRNTATTQILCACRYFAGERIELAGTHLRETGGRSFRLLLGVAGEMWVSTGQGRQNLRPGTAALIPGMHPHYEISGTGTYLDYYVPDLANDILRPLREEGYGDAEIFRLGGDPSTSDLSKC